LLGTDDPFSDFTSPPAREIGRLSCRASVDSRGLVAWAAAPETGLLVTPLNYDLRPRAYLNDEEVTMVRLNGTLSDVFVPKGDYQGVFKAPRDIYWILVWIQRLLYIFLAAFFIVTARKNRRENPAS